MCGDATNWDEDAYRETVLREREIQTRTVFRTAWAPPYTSNLDTLLVASSDGSVASYSISSSVVASKLKNVRIVSIPSFFLFFFSSIQVHTQPILFAFNYHFTSRAVSSLFLSNFDGETSFSYFVVFAFLICCSHSVLSMPIQMSTSAFTEFMLNQLFYQF